MYNPKLGRFPSPDPLIIHEQRFAYLSPYNFAGNTPIQAIDLQGLQPESVVAKTSDGRYQFTEPAIKLLSYVSGVDENEIREARVRQRAKPLGTPWFNSSSGGGGLTSKGKIRLTPNYFDNTGKYRYTDKKGYYGRKGAIYNMSFGNSVMEWLDINAHEVGHLPQAKKYKSSMGYYISFVFEYAMAGSHDGASREEEADQGAIKFREFDDYVNQSYGEDALKNLFKSEKTDEEKIETLNEWFKAYDESKTQEQKNETE